MLFYGSLITLYIFWSSDKQYRKCTLLCSYCSISVKWCITSRYVQLIPIGGPLHTSRDVQLIPIGHVGGPLHASQQSQDSFNLAVTVKNSMNN